MLTPTTAYINFLKSLVVLDTEGKYNNTNKYVSGDWPISTHADLRPHDAYL